MRQNTRRKTETRITPYAENGISGMTQSFRLPATDIVQAPRHFSGSEAAASNPAASSVITRLLPP